MMIPKRCVMFLACLALLQLGVDGWNGIARADQQGKPVEVDMVWSAASDNRHEIYHATRQAGQWSDPVMVTDDYYDNLQPVIDRDSQGKAWLVWTAYSSQRKELHYSVGQGQTWQQSKPIAAETTTNNAPSLAVDGEDVVWLVWAGNSGGDDDIYYTFAKDGQWAEPALLHGRNDRVDVLPVLLINEAGRPAVIWQALVDGDYVKFSSSYVDGAWSQEMQVGEEEEGTADEGAGEELILPSYIDENQTVFLRLYH